MQRHRLREFIPVAIKTSCQAEEEKLPSVPFKDEAEWLALRDSRVGGSEIASLFNQWHLPDGTVTILHAYQAPPEDAEFDQCLSSYMSSFGLYQNKAGVLPSDFKENERVTAGKFLEPALALWAQSVWPEWNLRKTRRYLDHDTVAGWGCSLDYELVAPGYPPVEFKNVDYLVFRDQWGAEEGEDGEVDIIPPIHINLQLQMQIGVTKADHGWIVVCVGGNTLKRVRVERHEPTQLRLAEAVEMFWTAVKSGVAPTWLADFNTVKRLATMSVNDMAPAADLSQDEAAIRDLRRYIRWKKHADYIMGHLERAKARIGLKMVDRTRAITGTEVGDITVSWPIVTRAAKMIPEKWQDEKSWRGGFAPKVIVPPKPKAPSKKKKAEAE
jgi:hypothetical protein